MENQQKTALITGANKGIGFEIARQLGALGFQVIVSGRDHGRVKKAVDQLHKSDINAIALIMDVGDVKSIRAAFESIRSTIKTVHVLINNAGIVISEDKSFLEFIPEEVHTTFSVNALGPYFVSQTFLPLIPKGGRIINISSGAGSICGGISNYAPLYSASKTAENALTMHLAQALKPKSIAANLVCPGWVKTDMGGPGASRVAGDGSTRIPDRENV
jgi:NAD(P)-dependent dehydrogenase (short-subunit alcohol dehydrogenase family)